MDTIHVKNIEEYQPTYNYGRHLIWFRWECNARHDYRISKLTLNAKWLFVVLVSIETETGKFIPNDINYLSREANIKKSFIPNALKMLQEYDLVVTKCDKMSPTDRQTDIHTDIQIDNIEKHPYGEDKKVKLSKDEHNKLEEKLGSSIRDDFIDRLNDYLCQKGKQYKSHYHTILSWARKDGAYNKPRYRKFEQTKPDPINPDGQKRAKKLVDDLNKKLEGKR